MTVLLHLWKPTGWLSMQTMRGSGGGGGGGGDGGRASVQMYAYIVMLVATLMYFAFGPQQAAGHHLHRTATPASSTEARRENAFTVITDNPFLIPHMPQRRKNELVRSVRMNIDSPYVSSLHLLNQAPNETLYPGGKLHVYDLGWRSTFLDAIRYANAALPPDSMFAIANADIVFSHETTSVLPRIKDSNVVVALSRHEVHDDGHATLHEDPPLSQDAWFMRTPFPEDPGFDFPMGTLGSDNKLAYIFKRRLNKTVVNWCNDVVIWHFHSSQHRGEKARIPQPYERAPNSRVNMSALSFAWRKHRLYIKKAGGMSVPVPTVALDLPRLSSRPMTSSNIQQARLLPNWSQRALQEMHAIAKRRIRQMHGSSLNRPEAHFLDLPWHLIAAESHLLQDGSMVRDLANAMPLDFMFTLVPEEVIPDLCRGALEWRELSIGAIDDRGEFTGMLVCPPLRRRRRRRQF